MYSYTELVNKFNRSIYPNKTEYKLENNTSVKRLDNGSFIINLHFSPIAQIMEDKIVLDTWGYMTHTTKDRLNKILSDNKTGYTIYQVNHTWFIYDNNIPDTRYKFANNVTFIPDAFAHHKLSPYKIWFAAPSRNGL